MSSVNHFLSAICTMHSISGDRQTALTNGSAIYYVNNMSAINSRYFHPLNYLVLALDRVYSYSSRVTAFTRNRKTMQKESFCNGCEDLTVFSFEPNVPSDDLAQYSPVFSNIIIYENVQSGIMESVYHTAWAAGRLPKNRSSILKDFFLNFNELSSNSMTNPLPNFFPGRVV